MQTRTKQEEEILKEIIENKSSEEKATAEFLSVCGAWEDKRSIDEQIRDVYSSRKSTNRVENVF